MSGMAKCSSSAILPCMVPLNQPPSIWHRRIILTPSVTVAPKLSSRSRSRFISAPSRSCPGIAGWAQIHGYRGETDAEEKMRKRVEYHLFYIDNWPLCLDLQIEARTPLSRTAYQNAYCPANRKRVIPAHAGNPNQRQCDCRVSLPNPRPKRIERIADLADERRDGEGRADRYQRRREPEHADKQPYPARLL